MPDKFRMKGYAAGGIPAFDLMVKRWKIRLLLPTRNELIEGLRTRFENVPSVRKYGIDHLVKTDLGELFLPRVLEKDTFWEWAEDGLWLYEAPSGRDFWQRTLVCPESLLPIRREVFTKNGESLFEVFFSEYERVQDGQLPLALKFISKKDGFVIKIKITSLRANVPLAGRAFSMSIPEGVKKITPKKLERDIQKTPDSH